MNSLIANEFPLRETQSLRYDLMDALTDDDLRYKLPGDNPTLGKLCQQMGEIEHIYVQSFTTLKMDWSYHHESSEIASSVEQLKAWYRVLDAEFENVLRRFTDEDLRTREIDRSHGFVVSALDQFQIYREAILMFYAKVSVYLKALQKPVNDQWKSWVG